MIKRSSEWSTLFVRPLTIFLAEPELLVLLPTVWYNSGSELQFPLRCASSIVFPTSLFSSCCLFRVALSWGVNGSPAAIVRLGCFCFVLYVDDECRRHAGNAMVT